MQQIMFEICNMLKHKGEILKAIVDKSEIPLSQIAKKMGINRTTIYRHFENPDLSLDYLMQYGKAIDVDMSKYFPEVLNIVMEPPAGYNSPKSYTELQDEAGFWKDKYIDILERYNKLLNEQLNASNPYTNNNNKRGAG